MRKRNYVAWNINWFLVREKLSVRRVKLSKPTGAVFEYKTKREERKEDERKRKLAGRERKGDEQRHEPSGIVSGSAGSCDLKRKKKKRRVRKRGISFASGIRN